MPPPPIAQFRRPTDPRRRPAVPARRSPWFAVAVIVASAGLGVVITDLVDPAGRVGALPGTAGGFLADFGLFAVLFGTGFAILSTIFDVIGAWERSTPESERRRDDGGDGGFLDLLGFGDCDGDGGDCGD